MMVFQCLPQVGSPQQEVFTKTLVGPQRGTATGFGKHSSVLVWLLHVHRLQLDCHISPGWKTGTVRNLQPNVELQIQVGFTLMK